MQGSDWMSGDESVAVVLTRHVPLANVVAFEAVLHDLLQIAITAPGHLGGDVLRGAETNGARSYHVVYRFRDSLSLAAWETSLPRLTLATQANALSLAATRQELTGMEAWFDVPNDNPPARWKMVIVTWIGIWPLVCGTIWATNPLIHTLGFLTRNAIVTALVVPLMAYLVMPPLAKLASAWLRRR